MTRWGVWGVLVLMVLSAGGVWLWYEHRAARLTLEDAFMVATLPGSICREQGHLSGNGVYNDASQTWWLDWVPSSAYVKPGCNPACVVHATSSAVEINWRCTGAVLPASKDDLITVDAPLPGAQVASPLMVSGQARGSWYFEAQFPVKLYDANGTLLGSVPAHASGDWMTTDYVPFSAALTFTSPTTATGTLVLEKDNPSGLPQNANELDIPVAFGSANTFSADGNVTRNNPGQKPGVWYLIYEKAGAPALSVELDLNGVAAPYIDLSQGERVHVEGSVSGTLVTVRSITPAAAVATQPVKLYYYNPALDQGPGGAQCSRAGLVAVDRNIPKTITPLTDTIKLLLRGELTAAEKAQGIMTEFPLPGVMLQSASITNGVATLTFADPQDKTSGGSCRAAVLWAQIEATAKQFPSVQSVQFKPETLFQP